MKNITSKINESSRRGIIKTKISYPIKARVRVRLHDPVLDNIWIRIRVHAGIMLTRSYAESIKGST